jgi:asparagine synthase (glutamine-hydrolysing)
MCHCRNRRLSRAQVLRMLARMAPRGPDARGEYDVPGTQLRLGHLRLSILDLDARSNQPFTSACGRYALTFNGEIYNFLELRLALAAQGVHFSTTSDTEVLLELLIRNGAKALDMLDGMFAFAFVDARERKLLLARDPIGEKPLYYSIGNSTRPTFVLPRSRACSPRRRRRRDRSAARLPSLHAAPPCQGIRELAPVCSRSISTHPRIASARGTTSSSAECAVRAATPTPWRSFAVTIRACDCARSDVPIGFYLSGGMD